MGAIISTSWGALSSIQDFLPPTPAAYTGVATVFQYFPIFSVVQWFLSWHPAGKTSMKSSIFNLPGRVAWCIMEIVGPLNLIYNLSQTSPSFFELPVPNQLVAALYCTHYLNRAVISPFFSAPSMSPIHVFIMFSAIGFNWLNSSCIAGWLSGYAIPIAGFRTDGSPALDPSSASFALVQILPFIGAIMFSLGMAGNIFSETELFRLRRESAEQRSTKKSDITTVVVDSSGSDGNKFHRVYVIPPVEGVFRTILYPHYVFEWLEWFGFMLVGTAVLPLSGKSIAPPLQAAPWVFPAAWIVELLGIPLPLPAVLFVINAVANMLPHARWGRKWYVEKFGEKAVAGRGAVIPGCAWM
ncbi:hypothetical protein N7520_006873 [Penicillium odoratum]|uniref:uncharacterized protein n=1 Tax=Penicillium odoratum TaxID=1167516 RepID=UPI0025466109|nr:uncharacterized protein N7520_006873 [Penicillium odoratum]KAJ5759717.1 hypothetical protein N7520_006873 [Penicillium odoratum]